MPNGYFCTSNLQVLYNCSDFGYYSYCFISLILKDLRVFYKRVFQTQNPNPSLTPDDDTFKHLAATYSLNHARMYLGEPCKVNIKSNSLKVDKFKMKLLNQSVLIFWDVKKM